MRVLLAFALFLLSALVARAETPFCGRETPHPIDVWFDATMQTAETTRDMRRVQAEAQRRWDHLLNAYYQEIRAKLSEAERQHFQMAQRAWLAFREAELQFLSRAVYTEGTMAPLILNDIARTLLKTRVCQLRHIRDELLNS